MTPLVYMAHPIGAATVEAVLLNIARAERWFRALCLAEPDVAFLASWLPYVKALDDTNQTHRARGIRDDHAIIERCRPNGIVLVGGRISVEMSAELEIVKRQRGWVSDLTACGTEPPPACFAPAGSLLEMGRNDWARRAA